MKLSYDSLEQIFKDLKCDSFYVFDSKKFEKNFDKLLAAFRYYYPNTNIAYSYKTNYIPRVCSVAKQKGGFAEVVSDMEMTLAKKLGVPSTEIYFNGPAKEQNSIENLLLQNGHVNVDSLEELNEIVSISKKYPNKKLKVGLRCSFDIKDGVISRFGFDIKGTEFDEAINIIQASKNIELSGLHCHFATRSLYSWENRTKGMLQLIEKRFMNHNFEYISLGGGLYGEMLDEMKKQFSVEIPTFEEYAKVSAKPFAEFFSNKKDKPLLLIEPGTALVANTMKYVTKVISIKTNQGRTIATLSGSSYNINPKVNRQNFSLPIRIFSNKKDRQYYEGVWFAGYTCIERDYLYINYNGKLAVGDYVVFDEVGSYSVVMKPPFIKPNVPIVEMIDSKSYKTIKRKENFNDIFHTYTMD